MKRIVLTPSCRDSSSPRFHAPYSLSVVKDSSCGALQRWITQVRGRRLLSALDHGKLQVARFAASAQDSHPGLEALRGGECVPDFLQAEPDLAFDHDAQSGRRWLESAMWLWHRVPLLMCEFVLVADYGTGTRRGKHA